MLSRLFVCAGGSGAVAQLRESFGAAGRAGGEGFAQTAREKENKANSPFISFKKKQKIVSSGSAQAEKMIKSTPRKNMNSYIIYINFYHFK